MAGGGEARMMSDSILEKFDLEFCHLKMPEFSKMTTLKPFQFP